MHVIQLRRPVTGAVTITTAAAIAAALAVSGGAAAGAATHAASGQSFAFGGNAYGSKAVLGSLVNSGKTAFSPLCTTHSGSTRHNRTGRVDLGAAGYLGAVTSAVHGNRTATGAQTVATTHTANTSLLTGVIKASALSTSATAARHGSTYRESGTSTITGLRIAGRAMPAKPKANSVYRLPGIGSVTLNAQHVSDHSGLHSITVTALQLVLSGSNTLNLPAGDIVVGRSTASLRSVHRVASGSAYASKLSLGSAASSGRTASAYTPCGGTGNSTRSNNVAGISIPGVATSGAAVSSTHTVDKAAYTTSTSQNRIARVNLFAGMITSRAVITRAHAGLADGRHTLSSAGTELLGLTIAGHAQRTPASGTKQVVPGLGTLYFGYAQKHQSSIIVYGLRLVLSSAHGDLPAGAFVNIGYAAAAVHAS